MKRQLEKKKKVVDEEELKRCEAELKEIEDNINHVERTTIYHIKDKENKMYKKAESASITGDTVGDPMKDTSGPSLNILIKLSSIISVVFGALFLKTSYLV